MGIFTTNGSLECCRCPAGFPIFDGKEDNHAHHARILRSLKLRTKSRQFDGEDARELQATNQRPKTHPQSRRLLRTQRRWQADLVQAEDRQLPRRAEDAGRDRVAATRGSKIVPHSATSYCGINSAGLGAKRASANSLAPSP